MNGNDLVSTDTLLSQTDALGVPYNIDTRLALFNKDRDWLNNPHAGIYISPTITKTEFNETVAAVALEGGITPANWIDWCNAELTLLANSYGDFDRIPDATVVSIVNKFQVLAGMGPVAPHTAIGVDPNRNVPQPPKWEPFSFQELAENITDSFQAVIAAPGKILSETKGTVGLVAVAVIVGGLAFILR